MEVKLVIVSFIFSQQEKEKYIFLLPLPCLSVVYYPCTSSSADSTPSPALSCYQVPARQCLDENIYLSENPWISWVSFWADPLDGWWVLMGSLSCILMFMLPALPIFEQLTCTMNIQLQRESWKWAMHIYIQNAMKAPISALKRVIHVFSQVLPPKF